MEQPHRMQPPKSLVAAGATVGLAVLVVFAARARAADVAAALRGAAWPLLAASLYRLVPLALNAASWRVLIPPPRRPGWRTILWLRWIGEAINGLLPAAQVGGDFARARLLTAGGVPAADATAAMVADVSIGAITQVVFTLLGAAALILRANVGAPARQHLGWLALVILVGALIAAALLAVARFGVSRLLSAMPLHLHSRLAARL